MSEWENKDMGNEALGEGVQEAVDENGSEIVKEAVDENGSEIGKEPVDEGMSEITREAVDENVGEIVQEAVDENRSEITKEAVDENMGEITKEPVDRIASWQERAAAENKPLIDNAIFGGDPFEKPNGAETNPWEEPRYGTAENEFGRVETPQKPVGGVPQTELPKKSSNAPMLIAMAFLFGLLIVLCCYVGKTISKGFAGLHVKKDTTYETDADDPWAEILGKNDDDSPNADADDFSYDDATADDPLGLFSKSVFSDDSWKQPYPNHKRSEFSGPYYEEFVDSIDESVPYTIERKFESIEDKSKNVCIRASYVQIDGDIPNLDEINRVLREKAFKDMELYEDAKNELDNMVKEYDAGIRSDIKSYVTFNDAETLSVAVMYDSNFCYGTELAVKGVNVNLVTGTIIDNAEILRLPDSFGGEFRQRSDKQNGESTSMELFSDEDIVSMLCDEDSIIIFYTPVGLELGYAYNRSGYRGWVTISMQDYKQYLNGM